MAKITKNVNKIVIVSYSSGIEAITALTSSYKPLI